MFVGILLHDSARDFGVEFESLRHREIFEISTRADKKTIGSHLKFGEFARVPALFDILLSIWYIKRRRKRARSF